MSDLVLCGLAVLGIVLVLIQMMIFGFDFDAMFFEKEDK
jgi:hypothetical protein